MKYLNIGTYLKAMPEFKKKSFSSDPIDNMRELNDWRESAKSAAMEDCGDEVHCTCVGPLRYHIKKLERRIEALIGIAREYGPQPPGHSCGPESNCDLLCVEFANFEQRIRDAGKSTQINMCGQPLEECSKCNKCFESD